MLFFYVSNIFIKNAFISKTRANSAKIRPFSESAHLIYLKTVKISSAKICVLTSVITNLYYSNYHNRNKHNINPASCNHVHSCYLTPLLLPVYHKVNRLKSFPFSCTVVYFLNVIIFFIVLTMIKDTATTKK